MQNAPTHTLSTNMAFVLFYTFKVIPILVGCFAIWLGYRLFILGVSGQASLSVQSNTVSGQLLNAAPGLFFAVGGIVTVIMSVWKGVDVRFSKPDEFIFTRMANIDLESKNKPADEKVIVDRKREL